MISEIVFGIFLYGSSVLLFVGAKIKQKSFFELWLTLVVRKNFCFPLTNFLCSYLPFINICDALNLLI